ncbi:septum formation family protein [Aeromicrobium alkaliterrae]|uniref:Septum formation-related domain-containing protein n=1 Tax=Aeromicrobium alkaliterrae TaxID=302168 RepID=A0ABN2JXS9_9ACTN
MTTTRRLLILTTLTFASLLLAGCGGTTETERDEDGAVTETNEDASVFDVKVGDCYILPDSSGSSGTSEVDTITAVPCSDPHEAEAYHEVELDSGDYPGDAEIQAAVEEACAPAFDTFVGLPYEESTLDVYQLFPTQDTWEQLDDRLISCLIYDPANAELTGTLEGAAR